MPDKPPRKRQRPRTGKQAIASARAEINRTRALALRLAGQTTRQIGDALGVDHSTAAAYINDALEHERRGRSEQVEQLRALEVARLESLLVRWMPIATSDKLAVESEVEGKRGPRKIAVADYLAGVRACDLVVKISARIAALYGLDLPNKVELSGTVGAPQLDPQLNAILIKAYGEAESPMAQEDRVKTMPENCLQTK